MRLTLRTLLAYMDDILEPADQEEMGQKIAESEFASDLVHRTRDVMRRLRLAPPQTSGRGTVDPNTVAEYLDNSLAPERVADFERVCLESNVHLAEVASCHQILTLILGEPAEIDMTARNRMYDIPTNAAQLARVRVEEAHEATSEAPSAEPLEVAPPQEKIEVPDYLRQSSRWGWGRLAVAAVILVVLAGVGYVAFRPDGFLRQPSQVADAESDSRQEQPISPPVVEKESDRTPDEDTIAEGSDDEEAANDDDGEATPGVTQPESPREEEASAPPAPGPPEESAVEVEEPVTPPEDAMAEGPDAEELPSESPPTDVQPPQPEPPVEVPEEAEQHVGLLVSDDMAVLLRYDPESSQWNRLASQTPLMSGDRLLALPTFLRPGVALGSGITFRMASGTVIELHGLDPNGLPVIEVVYGRLVIWNLGQPESGLTLRIDGEDYVVVFDKDARLAVELRREPIPGVDPEETPAPVVSYVVATSGNLHWGEGAEGISVQAPAAWNLVRGEKVMLMDVTEPPDWIDSEEFDLLSRRASDELVRALSFDRPASLTLRELLDPTGGPGRREEVRSLAARCSVHIGQFDPFITSLNDSDLRPAWRPKHIETLREAMALGPEVAGAIRQAFEQERGQEDATALFEMLWKYSPEGLEYGQDEELVGYLDHDRLDFRLLALWNLKRLTGVGSPDRLQDPRANRRQLVRRWKDRLDAGQVVPRQERAVPPPEPQNDSPASGDEAAEPPAEPEAS